jgi:regulator of sirC expression with transglutaminase-like and TPR domain
LVVAAGRALARGEPLSALALVGRLDSALGLTLRGIAYAQVGDWELAKQSLERALTRTDDERTRAHAHAALVEIALSTGASRMLLLGLVPTLEGD